MSNPRLPNPLSNDIQNVVFPCISENRTKVQILYRDKIRVYYSNVVTA